MHCLHCKLNPHTEKQRNKKTNENKFIAATTMCLTHRKNYSRPVEQEIGVQTALWPSSRHNFRFQNTGRSGPCITMMDIPCFFHMQCLFTYIVYIVAPAPPIERVRACRLQHNERHQQQKKLIVERAKWHKRILKEMRFVWCRCRCAAEESFWCEVQSVFPSFHIQKRTDSTHI